MLFLSLLEDMMVPETITCNVITCKLCSCGTLNITASESTRFSGYEVKSSEWYLGKNSLLKSHSALFKQ